MTPALRAARPIIHRLRGITLIELMIVIVVLGIIAAIAYPNYRDFAARGKRNEAKAALLQIATQQERFYLNNNTYTEDLTDLGFPVDDDFVTDSGAYTIDIPPGSADSNNFTAVATYNNDDTEAAKCKTFTIDGTGSKTSLPETDCWTRTR